MTDEALSSLKLISFCQVEASQIRTVLSCQLEVTSRDPSGEKAVDATEPEWPFRITTSAPVSTSQIITSFSTVVAASLPSNEKLTGSRVSKIGRASCRERV